MGPLTRLLDSTARNFGGQGVEFNKTLKNFGAFTKTLADNKDELFGTLAQVEKFTSTLAKNDQTVRQFNDSLAGGADLLADERQDLAAVLKNLSIAMVAGARLREGEPRLADPQHLGPEPDLQDPGQAARRARQDADATRPRP